MKKKYSIFFIVVACLSMGSTCHKPSELKLITPKQYSVPPHIPDELIVWRGKENTKNFLFQRIKSSAQVDNDTIHVDTCHSCDDQLEIWKGEAIKTFVQTEVARGSSGGSTKGVGDEKDSLFYSLNFIVKTPESGMHKYDNGFHSLQPAGSRVLVAVFDTGIDTMRIKVAGSPNGCKTDGEYGWNFVDKSSDVSDDNGHGTLVSQFMINQAEANVNILPVKVLGANGEGDLFKFLCGIAYAKKSGASVFNASLGFYYYNPEPPILLKNYLLNYIVNGQNKMICAAGNIDSSSDSIMRVMYGNRFPDSLFVILIYIIFIRQAFQVLFPIL